MTQAAHRKDYQFVDLQKFFFCLCVVAIHTNFLSDAYGIVAIFRLAVPFFFITSGFFFGKKVIKAEKSEIWQLTKRYCLRLLKIFLVFSAINIIENVVLQICEGVSFFEILKTEGLRLLFYPRGALWYISACMVGSLMLIPFLRAKKINLAVGVGIVLYGFSLVCNNYFFVFSNTRIELFINAYLDHFISARNGIFVGFLLLAIGIKCADFFDKHEDKITTKRTGILLIPAVALYVTEVILISKFAAGHYREDGGYYISQLILVPLLLLFALTVKINIPEKISRTFRDLSVGVYLLHAPVIFLIGFAELPRIANYFIVLAICVCICLLDYHFKKEPFYSLLR